MRLLMEVYAEQLCRARLSEVVKALCEKDPDNRIVEGIDAEIEKFAKLVVSCRKGKN